MSSTRDTLLFSGTITAAGYTAGEDYQIDAGGLTITQSTVAA